MKGCLKMIFQMGKENLSMKDTYFMKVTTKMVHRKKKGYFIIHQDKKNIKYNIKFRDKFLWVNLKEMVLCIMRMVQLSVKYVSKLGRI